MPTRATLLGRLKDLDDDASWQEFFELYSPLIYGRVRYRSLPDEVAEDVVMEIVAGIARRLPDFIYDPKRCRFKTWLFRIVENRVADHFRRRARALPRVESDPDGEASIEDIADPASLEPDQKWDEEWAASLAQEALERVRRRANPRYMQIYLYNEIEGHTVRETALHLQTTENDVSVAKHRIKELLREEGERLKREEKRREELGC